MIEVGAEVRCVRWLVVGVFEVDGVRVDVVFLRHAARPLRR